MTDIRIKRLGPTDAALHAAMQTLYADAFEDKATYLGHPPDAAYVHRALGNPSTIALVALDANTVVGALTAYELLKLEQARSEIYIYDLAVTLTHRRRGVATSLIEETQRIARTMDAWVAFVQADYGDDPAIALYTKLGTREDVMHFDLPVPVS